MNSDLKNYKEFLEIAKDNTELIEILMNLASDRGSEYGRLKGELSAWSSALGIIMDLYKEDLIFEKIFLDFVKRFQKAYDRAEFKESDIIVKQIIPEHKDREKIIWDILKKRKVI